MDILIPKQFNITTMYDLFFLIISNDLKPHYDIITFDFSNLKFIQPSGIVILSNMIDWLMKNNCKVFFKNHTICTSKKHDPIKFLDDCNFFNFYLKKNITSAPKIRSTTFPLKKITCASSYQWLSSSFLPWLQDSLSASSLLPFEVLRICLIELFQNIADHSAENIGCIFAQHYPNSKQIIIAISDFGVGIPNNVRKIYPFENDANALEIAIREGFSSKTNPNNMGAGLHILVNNIVKRNNGAVNLYSYEGILKIYNDHFEGFTTLKSNSNNSLYPGTFFEIIINTNMFNLNEIYEEDELKWD